MVYPLPMGFLPFEYVVTIPTVHGDYRVRLEHDQFIGPFRNGGVRTLRACHS